MDKTLVLVKPDAIERELAGAILDRLQRAGLKLVAVRMLHMDKAMAQKHYAVHTDKPFFNDLVDYITSAPIVAAVFAGNEAVTIARQAMGATDPAKADKGTIRGDFGIDIEHNSVHGSDSNENAVTEINLFFQPVEIFGS
jgi:nucleoside-diphosphate kinase